VPDLPYTDADLRHEAARQLKNSAEDPDFMGIGEQMDCTPIRSSFVDPDPEMGTKPLSFRTWNQLPHAEFGNAQRAIDDLLGKAADTSAWAVNLGADGLQPDERQFDVNAGDKVIARVHFAFDPDMADDMRDLLVTGLHDAISAHL
jgi:hypothetical protein